MGDRHISDNGVVVAWSYFEALTAPHRAAAATSSTLDHGNGGGGGGGCAADNESLMNPSSWVGRQDGGGSTARRSSGTAQSWVPTSWPPSLFNTMLTVATNRREVLSVWAALRAGGTRPDRATYIATHQALLGGVDTHGYALSA